MIKERWVGMLGPDGRAFAQPGPMPALKKGCVLVKVKASLISPGTELGNARALRSGAAPLPDPPPAPRAFGYQNAGDVLAVGEGVEQFRPGDRVACMGGGYALHATYAVVPQYLCARLPDVVSYEEGAFAHLAMTSLNAVRRGAPELGETVLAVGLGMVGQMAARLSQLSGASVMGWDMLPTRCRTAMSWALDAVARPGTDDLEATTRAFTRELGFDMAVLTVPGDATAVLQDVRKAMKQSPDHHEMGRLCMVGGTSQCVWGAGLGNLDLRACSRTGPGYHDDAWELGETTYPKALVRWTTRSNMELVLRLMAEDKLPVDRMITHRIPLERIDDAVRAHLEETDTTLGTVLLMNQF